MKRHAAAHRSRLRLETLEDRCTPSATPFHESLTLLNSAGGVATYEGTGTHVGKVSAVEYFNPNFNPSDPDSVFATYVKYAANGDALYGTVIPDDPAMPFTTGDLTIDGGTGRFQGATGTSDYVVSSNAKTGATLVDVTGTIDYAPGGRAGQQDPQTLVLPFKVKGGGPAPGGLPLFPDGTGPHFATNTATGLGKGTGEGQFVLKSLSISPTGQVSGTFEGSFTFVAANGDRLTFEYGSGGTGTFTGHLSADLLSVQDVTFDAVFTPDAANSTGRFADVVGGNFRMIALAPSISLVSMTPGYTAPFDYTWSGEGFLVFSKAKK